MKIRIIQEEKEFLSLKDDWDRLNEGLSPITGFDWMYGWWQHFKGNHYLNILVAEDNGKVVGIAPLFLTDTKALKLIPVRSLGFLGGDVSDFLDFLIDKNSNREAVFKSLLDHMLNSLSYDFAELNEINSDYPNFDLWNGYSNSLKLKLTPFKENHRINLSMFSSYKDFFDKLNKNLKRSLKYRQNKIKKDGVNIRYVFRNSIIPEDLKRVSELNIKRQMFLYGKGIRKRDSYFLDEKKERFIKEFFTSENSNKMITIMQCNSVTIAYFLILVYGETLALWNCGFDPEYENYCPSKLLINEIVKYAFNNNYKYANFLRGNDPYKLQWTNERAVNHKLVSKKSLKSKLIFLYRDYVPEFITFKFRDPGIKIHECENIQ